MKQLTLIFLSLLISVYANGQTLQDKQNVIQQCIDLDALQMYYSDIEFEGKQQLFIVDNGVVSNNLKLLKYKNEVTFMLKKEMFFKNIKNHIDFSNFIIDSENADVKYRYGIIESTVHIEFHKDNDI